MRAVPAAAPPRDGFGRPPVRPTIRVLGGLQHARFRRRRVRGWFGGDRRRYPSRMSISRSHVSRGDSAPASTRSSAFSSCRSPRVWRCRAANSSTSQILSCVALAKASRRATASSSRPRRPRSKAVRSGVVTMRSPNRRTSLSSNSSSRVITPFGGRAFGQISSTGSSSSIHLDPCIADADNPETIASPRDHRCGAVMR